MYFVIHNSDGDTKVELLDKEKLLERLNEDYYGKTYFIPEHALQKPTNRDTNAWGDGLLIIKGEVVAPQAKETVLRYDIE